MTRTYQEGTQVLTFWGLGYIVAKHTNKHDGTLYNVRLKHTASVIQIPAHEVLPHHPSRFTIVRNLFGEPESPEGDEGRPPDEITF